MKKWEFLEQYYLSKLPPFTEFNSVDVAQTLRISRYEASELIQAYLTAVRSPKSKTQFALFRRGRTNATMWRTDVTANSVRARTRQAANDMVTILLRAVRPDLEWAGVLHPQIQTLVNNLINVVDAQLQMMIATLP